jgi:hypothetical protein
MRSLKIMAALTLLAGGVSASAAAPAAAVGAASGTANGAAATRAAWAAKASGGAQTGADPQRQKALQEAADKSWDRLNKVLGDVKSFMTGWGPEALSTRDLIGLISEVERALGDPPARRGREPLVLPERLRPSDVRDALPPALPAVPNPETTVSAQRRPTPADVLRARSKLPVVLLPVDTPSKKE